MCVSRIALSLFPQHVVYLIISYTWDGANVGVLVFTRGLTELFPNSEHF